MDKERLYQYSNNELVELLNGEISAEDREFVTQKIVERFKWDSCTKPGETRDELFARNFSDFVNGRCRSKKAVAEKMSHDHRYLQNEMFHICLEYIKILAENCEKGYYDPRNRYAAETSKMMIDALKNADYPY